MQQYFKNPRWIPFEAGAELAFILDAGSNNIHLLNGNWTFAFGGFVSTSYSISENIVPTLPTG